MEVHKKRCTNISKVKYKVNSRALRHLSIMKLKKKTKSILPGRWTCVDSSHCQNS